MTKKYTGRCACGAVKFDFDTDPTFVAVCHCLDCKKSSGGEAATFFGVPEDDFTLISGEPKAFHYIAQSGKGLDRNFCPSCGARVFSTNLESFPGLIFVTIGSLDNPKGIEPTVEMFTKRRLEWAKPLDLPQFENMPVERVTPAPSTTRLSLRCLVISAEGSLCKISYKGAYHESPDGSNLPRQARRHRPQDRVLAGGAGRALL